MAPIDHVKRFATNNLLINAALSAVEEAHQIQLRDRNTEVQVIDETYYPQFDERFRSEAADMAANFRIFYCLENSIRELISEALEEHFGETWWNDAIAVGIKTAAEGLRQKEMDMGAVPRSTELLDYTTFGELSTIIEQSKEAFEGRFTSFRAVNRVLWQLNMLRGPIAHCKPLAEDEVLRLHLSLRDWFRALGE
jgi:hypothetical protein